MKAIVFLKGCIFVKENKAATALAILAAALYALNIPFSKLLLERVPPTVMAGLLYIGAGVGMAFLLTSRRIFGIKPSAPPLSRADLPYTVAMVLLDIAAPVFLMLGLTYTSSANASLLNNFEIVVTSLVAFLVFREKPSTRLVVALVLVVAASVLLSFEGETALKFNTGSLFVLLAAVFWGIENNCTRNLSEKSSEEIVLVKGLISGLGSIVIAFIIGEKMPSFVYIILVMLLGFVAYGLSINFYIMAQKHLGAARTGAFYSVAPFIGVLFSFLFLGERPRLQFYIGLAVMCAAAVFMVADTLMVGSDRK